MATDGDETQVEVVGVFERREDLPEGEERIPLLVFRDGIARRELQIPIGSCEGFAIHVAIQQHVVARPLTHDLALRILEKFSATLQRVVIDDLRNGVYYASIHLTADEGEIVLPARPGDAVAMALRAEAPVYVTEAVFGQATQTGDDIF